MEGTPYVGNVSDYSCAALEPLRQPLDSDVTNERRADARPGPRGGRVLILASALVLSGAACERGPSGTQSASPEPPGAVEVREAAVEECRTFGRLLGLDGLAQEIDARTEDPRDLATAYAARATPEVRDAAFEGCLAGARDVFAMEEEAARIAPEAEEAAERAGCTTVRVTPDQGQGHIQPGEPPPEYATIPAASGPHSASPLPPDVPVYHVPVEEPSAVHSLEHGYTLLYYRAEAVAAESVALLEGLAREFDKVITAPYPGLPNDTGFAFVAWRHLQRCPPTISARDAEVVARSYVLRFAATDVAPEPLGP
jgi:hypothetical protein